MLEIMEWFHRAPSDPINSTMEYHFIAFHSVKDANIKQSSILACITDTPSTNQIS